MGELVDAGRPGGPVVLVARVGFPDAGPALARRLPWCVVRAAAPEQLADAVAGADVLVPLLAPVDAALLDSASRLRLVHQWGSGVGGIDVEAAHARAIAVCAVSTEASGAADAVAEWCLMACVALFRRIPSLVRELPRGASWGSPVGRTLAGASATVVGLGHVGRRVVALLGALGAVVTVVTEHPEAGGVPAGVRILPRSALIGVLAATDVVVICVRVTRGDAPVVGAAELAALQGHAIVVNAARSDALDHSALLGALEAGRLGGAALDVFPDEPLTDREPLLERDDVLATPHIAGVVGPVVDRVCDSIGDNVRRLLAGEPLVGRVAPAQASAAAPSR